MMLMRTERRRADELNPAWVFIVDNGILYCVPTVGLATGVPFRLAASSGTIVSHNSAQTVESLTSKESSPESWLFKIHEDTADDYAGNMMTHYASILDISSNDESRVITKSDRGKENIPLTEGSVLSSTNVTTSRANTIPLSVPSTLRTFVQKAMISYVHHSSTRQRRCRWFETGLRPKKTSRRLNLKMPLSHVKNIGRHFPQYEILIRYHRCSTLSSAQHLGFRRIYHQPLSLVSNGRLSWPVFMISRSLRRISSKRCILDM